MLPDRILVKVLEPADSEALLAMVGRCSPTALYRRFHGITDGVSYAQQVLADAGCRDSFAAWSGDDCVGLGNLHVCDDTAEIGVLVEDGWHRRGVGTALAVALVRRARERRSHFLRAEVLAENRFALPVLARFGPTRISLAHGSYTMLVDLALGTALAQTSSLTTGPSEILPIQSVSAVLDTAVTPIWPGGPTINNLGAMNNFNLLRAGENGHWAPFSWAS
jgi:GNAT superfamily N-acetyltransferase